MSVLQRLSSPGPPIRGSLESPFSDGLATSSIEQVDDVGVQSQEMICFSSTFRAPYLLTSGCPLKQIYVDWYKFSLSSNSNWHSTSKREQARALVCMTYLQKHESPMQKEFLKSPVPLETDASWIVFHTKLNEISSNVIKLSMDALYSAENEVKIRLGISTAVEKAKAQTTSAVEARLGWLAKTDADKIKHAEDAVVKKNKKSDERALTKHQANDVLHSNNNDVVSSKSTQDASNSTKRPIDEITVTTAQEILNIDEPLLKRSTIPLSTNIQRTTKKTGANSKQKQKQISMFMQR